MGNAFRSRIKNFTALAHKFLGLVVFSFIAVQAQAAPLPGMNFTGDFRYRHEKISQEQTSVSSYSQQRIRARLSGKAAVAEDTEVEIRLATGTGRVSTNQTLGASSSAFANYTIGIDRAYVLYNPLPYLRLLGGREPNPLHLAGGSDLTWDSDLNFDGVAMKLENSWGNTTPFFSAGAFWVDKTTAVAQKDVLLHLYQGGLKHSVNDDLRLSANVSFQNYTGLTDHLGLASTTSTNGNSYVAGATAGTRRYRYDFNVLGAGVDVTYDCHEIPITVFLDGISNLAVDSDGKGWILGVKAGKTKKKGDWIVSYDFRKTQRDATVGAFTESDAFVNGGVNGNSHRLSASYLVHDRWSVSATYHMGNAGVGKDDNLNPVYRRKLMADLSFNF